MGTSDSVRILYFFNSRWAHFFVASANAVATVECDEPAQVKQDLLKRTCASVWDLNFKCPKLLQERQPWHGKFCKLLACCCVLMPGLILRGLLSASISHQQPE